MNARQQTNTPVYVCLLVGALSPVNPHPNKINKQKIPNLKANNKQRFPTAQENQSVSNDITGKYWRVYKQRRA